MNRLLLGLGLAMLVGSAPALAANDAAKSLCDDTSVNDAFASSGNGCGSGGASPTTQRGCTSNVPALAVP